MSVSVSTSRSSDIDNPPLPAAAVITSFAGNLALLLLGFVKVASLLLPKML